MGLWLASVASGSGADFEAVEVIDSTHLVAPLQPTYITVETLYDAKAHFSR